MIKAFMNQKNPAFVDTEFMKRVHGNTRGLGDYGQSLSTPTSDLSLSGPLTRSQSGSIGSGLFNLMEDKMFQCTGCAKLSKYPGFCCGDLKVKVDTERYVEPCLKGDHKWSHWTPSILERECVRCFAKEKRGLLE